MEHVRAIHVINNYNHIIIYRFKSVIILCKKNNRKSFLNTPTQREMFKQNLSLNELKRKFAEEKCLG